jgi:hypothetical protein
MGRWPDYCALSWFRAEKLSAVQKPKQWKLSGVRDLDAKSTNPGSPPKAIYSRLFSGSRGAARRQGNAPYRELADARAIPKGVWNMQARHGGATEAHQSGVQQHVANQTHYIAPAIETTTRAKYWRARRDSNSRPPDS